MIFCQYKSNDGTNTKQEDTLYLISTILRFNKKIL